MAYQIQTRFSAQVCQVRQELVICPQSSFRQPCNFSRPIALPNDKKLSLLVLQRAMSNDFVNSKSYPIIKHDRLRDCIPWLKTHSRFQQRHMRYRMHPWHGGSNVSWLEVVSTCSCTCLACSSCVSFFSELDLTAQPSPNPTFPGPSQVSPKGTRP